MRVQVLQLLHDAIQKQIEILANSNREITDNISTGALLTACTASQKGFAALKTIDVLRDLRSEVEKMPQPE
jgi:hypothetical protein